MITVLVLALIAAVAIAPAMPGGLSEVVNMTALLLLCSDYNALGGGCSDKTPLYIVGAIVLLAAAGIIFVWKRRRASASKRRG